VLTSALDRSNYDEATPKSGRRAIQALIDDDGGRTHPMVDSTRLGRPFRTPGRAGHRVRRGAASFVCLTAIVTSLLAPPIAAAPPPVANPTYKILVFTAGATATGPAEVALKAISKTLHASVVFTADPAKINRSHLQQYRAVVFLNTGVEILDEAQRAAFEEYFHAGGGFVGVGSAIDTEPGWSFFSDLLGTRSAGRTAIQPATIKVADRGHVASAALPEYWTWTDAWYNYTSNVRGFSHVLATVVEDPFTEQLSGLSLDGIAGGTMGADHPVSWCKDYLGGRSFYTGLGNTSAGFSDAAFRSHLGGAIQWAAGVADRVYSDCGATVLANYQQTKVSAPPNLLEPIGFDVFPDGRVIQTTRGGEVRLHDADAGTTSVIATLPVYTNSEDGLYGPAIDNGFATNHWVYLYYAPQVVHDVVLADGSVVTQTTPLVNDPATPINDVNAPTIAGALSAWDPYVGYFQLSRFKFVDGASPHLDLASEQQILRVPNNRGACCHVAGDIDFDTANDLWLVTGDDTPAGGGNSGGFGPFNGMLTNESQTLAVGGATGGTFTLTFEGQTTAPIAVPLVNTEIEAALEALSNLDNVTVTGTGTRTIRFDGPQEAERNVALLTADPTGLTGTAPAITVAMATVNAGQGVNIPAEGGLFNAPHVDARRSAQNTNDLRGKLLRITVAADGSYTVPAGNLFAPGTAKTRPEIYAMGFRNPFRVQVDSDGVAYITDYSPDSQTPSQFRGPPGTGRVEIVRGPANYGWPLCYRTDLPYYRWNFNTTQPLDSPPLAHECGDATRGPQNDSRWNLNGGPTVQAGLEYGPPITNPDIWYSYQDNTAGNPLGTPCFSAYGPSPLVTCPQREPELGTGGVGAHGADVYEFDPESTDTTRFPAYYDGAVILGEFTRDYLREIRLDAQNRVFKINNALSCGAALGNPIPSRPFECDNPMDLQFDDDGHLYLLTYGDGFFAANPDAGMYRFDYVKGLRDPKAVISATPTNGQEPLTVAFSSVGSLDPDPADSITFAWDFDGNGSIDSIDADPTYVYTVTGRYTAILTVTDSSGRSASASTIITVGNTAPTVDLTVPVEGGTFAFGDTIPFAVTVSDPEDGSIDCSRVTVTFVLGHDTHGHAEAQSSGCSGTLPTDADDASHGGNVFGVISATYTDLGDGAVPTLTTTDQHQIRQKRQEVESAVEQQGTNTAASADTGGGLQRGSLGNGDWIALNGPFNLVNIGSITFRTSGGNAAGAPSATVEIHLDAVDGPLLTTATINGTASGTTYTSQTFPLTDPGGLHKVYLVFRPVAGGPTNNFFNLNWTEFGGSGIAIP
jgi:PKD repeat protein/type 1 glutamine amidotransferase